MHQNHESSIRPESDESSSLYASLTCWSRKTRNCVKCQFTESSLERSSIDAYQSTRTRMQEMP